MADADAMLSMTTPLGDALRPTALQASEAISTLFTISVTMLSTQAAIDANTMLYQPVCVKLHRPPATDRYFHGIVRHFAAVGLPTRGYWTYQAELVPKLWFMGQTEDCRIFQNVAIADILTALFSENGITDTQFKIYGAKPVRDYITQYNETDLAFATRLMEEAGYYYFFVHGSSGHTLVLTDRNQAFAVLAQPTHHVVAAGGNAEILTSWRQLGSTATGAVTLLDYDPENPDTLPTGNTTTTRTPAGASLRDVFRWPALTVQASDAVARSKLRIEAAEARAALFEATGSDQAMVPGGKFTIARDPFSQAQGVEYVVRSVSHAAQDDTWIAGAGEPSYSNSLTAFPAATTWREPMTTPRPVMAGIHAAIVLGNSGEEIHSERLARVKIRFFWDHRADATAATVCWVRVLQPWSGNTWGWQHLPRVGTEVGVAFMDGDPDRPVMVGCFYNNDMMPVFPVPDQQTKSGIRTRSTAGGGTSDFSEFSFDDKKGSELVFLHAQKDAFTEIENNQTLTVDNCRMVTIKQDETVDIGNNQLLTVKVNRTTEVTQGNDKLTVKAGNLAVETTMGGITHTTLQDYAVKSNTGNVKIDALQSIVLTVGANSVKIDQEGITVSGLMVKVQGQVMVQVQGTMTQVSGDAMLTLKGGIMMLN
jgi:type VI secretion system secreted protein VgrG